MKRILPEWLTQELFYGEDPNPENESGASEDEGDEEDNEDGSDDDEEDGSSDEGDDEGDEDEEGEDELEPLRTALKSERKLHRSERKARISAERERDEAIAKLSAGTDKESETINSLQTQLNTSRDTNEKLARGFANQALHTAIVKIATKESFIDPEDALVLMKNLDVDQDDEDPTQVEVDEASVLAEVKSLAKRKPHLVGKKKTPEKKPSSGTPRARRQKKTSRKAGGYDPADYPSLRSK